MQRENGKRMLKSASMLTSKFNLQNAGFRHQNFKSDPKSLEISGNSDCVPIPGFSQSTKFLDSSLDKNLTKQHDFKGRNKIQRPSTQCEGPLTSTQNVLSLKQIIENEVFKQNLVGGSPFAAPTNHTRSHEECNQKFYGTRLSQTINCGKDLGLDEELLASLPANFGDQEDCGPKQDDRVGEKSAHMVDSDHNSSLLSDKMISLEILKQQISPEKDPNSNQSSNGTPQSKKSE